jgi:hypothetical protein
LPTGQSTNGICMVVGQGHQIQITFMFAYQQMGQDGMMHQVQEQNPFQGTISGLNIQAICQQAQLTIDGVPMAAQGVPFRIALAVAPDGSSMQGQFTNALGITATVYLVRQ